MSGDFSLISEEHQQWVSCKVASNMGHHMNSRETASIWDMLEVAGMIKHVKLVNISNVWCFKLNYTVLGN